MADYIIEGIQHPGCQAWQSRRIPECFNNLVIDIALANYELTLYAMKVDGTIFSYTRTTTPNGLFVIAFADLDSSLVDPDQQYIECWLTLNGADSLAFIQLGNLSAIFNKFRLTFDSACPTTYDMIIMTAKAVNCYLTLHTLESLSEDIAAVDSDTDSRLDALETITADHETRLDNAEADIMALEITDTTQNSRLTAVEGVNTTQNGRLTALETSDGTQNTRLTAIEGVNTTQNSRLTSLESSDTAQNTRLTRLESATILPFPFASSSNKTGTGAYDASNWFAAELTIPSDCLYLRAKLTVKCEATSSTAVFDMSVSEIAANATAPAGAPIAASIVNYATGGGVRELTSGYFTIVPGRTYIVSVKKVSGPNAMNVYSADLSLYPPAS